MSAQARYVGSWGFSVAFYKLWKVAYAWRSLKLFRLVRLRHQNTLHNQTLLASLPIELLDIIEGEILRAEMDDAFNGIPDNECDCEWLWDQFNEEDHVLEAFDDFCYDAVDFDPDTMSRAELWAEFENSQLHEDLCVAYHDEHFVDCETRNAGMEFWRELVSSCAFGHVSMYIEPRLYAHLKTYKQKDSDTSMLHNFLADHHLEMPRFKLAMAGDYFDAFSDFDDLCAQPELEPVRLIFTARKCWYTTRIKPAVPGPFAIDKTKLFPKLKAYGIMPTGSKKKKGNAAATVPMKWTTRRYEGEPVDLSGNRIIGEKQDDEPVKTAGTEADDKQVAVEEQKHQQIILPTTDSGLAKGS